MTARLFVREVGQREFVKQNDFESPQLAHEAGEALCTAGNVEEFEIWLLHGAYEREWSLKKTGGE